MYLLGYDIGSSSVKAALIDAETGKCIGTHFAPESEAPIKALQTGWAEQDPSCWWSYIKESTGFLCPSCGITRATKEILNLNIPLAIEYNAYYTLVLIPIFTILFVDDIICIIIRKRSFVDIIFSN